MITIEIIQMIIYIYLICSFVVVIYGAFSFITIDKNLEEKQRKDNFFRTGGIGVFVGFFFLGIASIMEPSMAPVQKKEIIVEEVLVVKTEYHGGKESFGCEIYEKDTKNIYVKELETKKDAIEYCQTFIQDDLIEIVFKEYQKNKNIINPKEK